MSLIVGLPLACAGKPDGDAESPAKKLADEGWRLVERGDEPEGAAKLEEAAKLAPDDADISFKLCQAWLAADQAPKALTKCQRAAELGPKNADAHYSFGTTAFQLEHHDKALDALRTAIEVDPKHAAAHHQLSTVLLSGKPSDAEKETALAEAKQAVVLDSSEPLYEVGLCRALIESGACEEASQHIVGIEDEVEVGKLRALHYDRCGN